MTTTTIRLPEDLKAPGRQPMDTFWRPLPKRRSWLNSGLSLMRSLNSVMPISCHPAKPFPGQRCASISKPVSPENLPSVP
jgi:hypothetical protein